MPTPKLLSLLLVVALTACGGADSDSASAAPNIEAKPGTGDTQVSPPDTFPPVVDLTPSPNPPTVDPTPNPPAVDPTSPVLPPITSTPNEPFPEPTSARFDPPDNSLGFYDVDASGKTRAVRHDLQGSLQAMVQFGQNLTVDPSGNEAKNMPRLVSEREALLLITPDPSLGDIDSLTLTATVNGQVKPVLALRAPIALYRADRPSKDNRPDVTYSRRAWSVVLPWDWVQPGLALSVKDNTSRTGTLAAEAIDFGAPGELMVNNIRLGMLTAPPQSTGHYMLLQPAKAAADYFQTIPAARLTVAGYEDMTLDKVMVASGVIYTSASATTGDVYSGDMRGDTAKSTFSTGINLANWGVTSAGMMSQQQPQLTQEAIVHHARGIYSNGAVDHGLSGGNGILTLIDSVGNEFSHEIGHHYGLGHYPGQVGTNCFTCAHNYDSGWGYIAYRHRMRANLNWTSTDLGDGSNGVPDFQGLYGYQWDAMAGGSSTSGLSRYTLYTGYSSKIAIQPAFDKVVITPESPTGFSRWNKTTRKMEAATPAVPTSTEVWYNAADGKFRKPRRFGVPVVTILGGYDPVASTAVLYPAARSNWGNVFDLPAPVANAAIRQCWLSVEFAGGQTKLIAVAPTRMGSNANKLAVNLAQDEKPSAAKLFCQEPGAAAKELANVSVPQNLPAMAPAVIIGKGEGYAALRKVEMPELEAALLALAGKTVLILPPNASLLYDSYADYASELSPLAKVQFDRYADQQQRARRLNRWIYAYRSQLQAKDPAAEAALLALIDKLGLRRTSPLLPVPTSMKVAGVNCLKADVTNIVVDLYIAAPASCTGVANETWVVDASNHVRNGANLGMCLTDQGNVKLAACDAGTDAQTWDVSALPAIKRAGKCMDLSSGHLTNGRGTLITYSCSGGSNQQWTGVTLSSDNLLLPLLESSNLRIIQQLGM